MDRFFQITERGSTVGREVRGGVVTFFTMAYIIVLNPLIIGTVQDGSGRFLGGSTEAPDIPLVALATAVVAGVMTLLMGVVARYPLALATGLGLNAFVTYSIATKYTWTEAMTFVFLEGVIILVLVLTGFRTAVFRAVPASLKTAISVGIGLFITIIGLVDAGIVRTPAGGGTPLELGVDSGDLEALGSQESHSVPADRALLAAAVASSAGVVVVPRAALPGDIPVAAVLRYTDASTPGGNNA